MLDVLPGKEASPQLRQNFDEVAAFYDSPQNANENGSDLRIPKMTGESISDKWAMR
jgi:hypothetical protein